MNVTIEDLKEWVKILAPFVTGVGGAFLGFKARLRKLEHRHAALSKKVEAQTVGFPLLVTGAQAALEEQVKELKDELDAIEEQINKVRESNVDFAKDAELAQFMMEQHDQWQKVQRTLGHIEGYLQATGQRMPPQPSHPPLPSTHSPRTRKLPP